MKIAARSILIVLLLLAQVAGAQNRERVKTTGDTLIGAGQDIEQVVGHVEFVQGPLYGSANKAVYNRHSGVLELIGNVEVHQDTLSLYAPHVLYNDSTGIGHAEGNVRLFDRTIELTAAEGDYDMNSQMARFRHHVTITEKKSTSVSDSLIYYRSTQTTILLGHALAKSDSGSLAADTIIYVKALDETTAKGNAILTNDSLRMSADWLFDSRPLGRLLASGHVAVENIPNKTTIFGDTLARFALENYMLVPRNPLLEYLDSTQVRDSTGKMVTTWDTTFVRSDTMKIYSGDSARFVAIDSVRMLRLGFSLIGGMLVFDQNRDLITVSKAKRQRLWNDSTEIDADSVAMTMRDRHIQRIYAIGHAFATSPVDEFPNSGRIHQLEGDSMVLVVVRDTARNLYDLSSALSIYFLVNNGRPDGVNRASGDTIRMDFKGKSVQRIAVISGTEGEYFPERFVGKRAVAFRLTDYERHTGLRPLRDQFVVPWLLREAETLRTEDSDETEAEQPAPVQKKTSRKRNPRNPAK